MTTEAPFGFLNIDKPLGMTSHDVVAKVRRKFGMKRVGHAGTLDPLATGVLVICLGAATRLSEYVMDTTKQYEARVHLGITTTTYDAEGEIVKQRDAGHVTRDDVEAALPQFTGEIDQLPPVYSAIKQGGRKLYELARAGETVDLTPRRVTIQALEITDWSPPQFSLCVTCGAGTYIRSLACDLGEALGIGAYLAGLVRTASGRFNVQDAVSLPALLESESPRQFVIPPREGLSHYPALVLDDAQIEHIRHGRALPDSGISDGMTAIAYDAADNLLSVLRAEGGLWKPQKVFIS